jgi:hypothetical protein
MAPCAGLDASDLAVDPGLAGDLSLHLYMALNAQASLGGLQRLVAAAALFFEVCVGGIPRQVGSRPALGAQPARVESLPALDAQSEAEPKQQDGRHDYTKRRQERMLSFHTANTMKPYSFCRKKAGKDTGIKYLNWEDS